MDGNAVAAVLTALATLVTAVGWARAQWANGRKIEQVHQSVGPTNGADLATMVGQIQQLEEYTHVAVHDLRNRMTPVAATLPVLTGQVSKITAHLGLDDPAPPAAV